MPTVTGRIKEIKQPRGGYAPLKMFDVYNLGGEIITNDDENISAILVGIVVDYLTRFIMSKDAEKSFDFSLKGAMAKDHLTKGNGKWLKTARKYLKKVKGLDDKSIAYALNLADFDTWYRNPSYALMSDNNNEVELTRKTIENIRSLVQRGVEFFEKYGPITKYEFNFYPPNYEFSHVDFSNQLADGSVGGYTKIVSAGDGDYLTEDTLWDFKVSKNKPTSIHTLQILMYWIMGQHSGQEVFKNITKIGIFNPRLNSAYQLEVSKIPVEVIETIEKDIIGY